MSTALALAISSAAVILASVSGALIGARSSSRAARELDDLARRRSQKRARARIRTAAAFVRTDIDASRRRLRDAMEDGEWHIFYRLPTRAWRDHGPTVAPSCSPTTWHASLSLSPVSKISSTRCRCCRSGATACWPRVLPDRSLLIGRYVESSPRSSL
jgi:hypothetical protein